MSLCSAALQYAVGQDIELEGTVLVRLALFHAKISKVPVTYVPGS